jgi:translation initiation factor 1 (eIF-1/SUI1)
LLGAYDRGDTMEVNINREEDQQQPEEEEEEEEEEQQMNVAAARRRKRRRLKLISVLERNKEYPERTKNKIDELVE